MRSSNARRAECSFAQSDARVRPCLSPAPMTSECAMAGHSQPCLAGGADGSVVDDEEEFASYG